VNEFRLQKRSAACGKCERPFEAGATIVSLIRELGDEGFERTDLCEACSADAAAGAYSVWRAQQPAPPEDPHRLDFDLALEFFDRLVREADPAREGLVYTLTLLLSRKRRVKIRETRRVKDGEILSVVLPRAEEDETVSVRAPRLTNEDVDRLQGDLARLFGFAPEAASPEGGHGAEGGDDAAPADASPEGAGEAHEGP